MQLADLDRIEIFTACNLAALEGLEKLGQSDDWTEVIGECHFSTLFVFEQREPYSSKSLFNFKVVMKRLTFGYKETVDQVGTSDVKQEYQHS